MSGDTIRRTVAAIFLVLAEAFAVVACALALTAPAGAQIFDDRFPFQRLFPPGTLQGPPPDNSRAPAPRRVDSDPLTSVVVMGDSMADWLAYGLEAAFAESPEVGILRKHRATSGLIRNDTRSDHPDWPQLARDILAAEKANFVIMMIGVHDRQAIRERMPAQGTEPPQQPGGEQADGTPSIVAPEQPRPGATIGVHEFRSEKWIELYVKRIDDTIAALKSKGTNVFWVGLPSIRGPRSTSDAIFLNDLFRSRAEKAGIAYIDVWDGFVDEAGRFSAQGPDFEGQIRRLRSADGVHFTQAGARKLAHYIDREIQRSLTSRTTPVAVPVEHEPFQQAPAMLPGTPVARPLSGPVLPLTAAVGSTEELLGGGAVVQNITDAIATRVLVRGEPMPAPAGRADDVAWPRRDIAPVGADPVVATTTLPMTPMLAPVQIARTGAGTADSERAAGRASNAARPPAGAPQRQAAAARPAPPPQSAPQSMPFFLLFRPQ